MNFDKIAQAVARSSGRPLTFIVALALIVVWGISGPVFHFSDTWQLVVNTGTTIVTFLMVFLIQNAQNRESKAIHLKLDELILTISRANNILINAESFSEEELDRLGERHRRVAEKHRRKIEKDLETVGREVDKVEQRVEQVGEHVAEVESKARSGRASQ